MNLTKYEYAGKLKFTAYLCFHVAQLQYPLLCLIKYFMKYQTSTSTQNTSSKIIQNQYHQYLESLDSNEFTLFHLTTTYLPYQDRTYTAKDLNKFFINFYLKNLLTHLFHTRTWTKTKKMNQPIVLSFLDEHETKPVQVSTDTNENRIYAHPIRLHHHSIIASRPATTEKFIAMCGDNTMLRHSPKMMTSNLVQCDADRVFYASKMLWKYPSDYLLFGRA